MKAALRSFVGQEFRFCSRYGQVGGTRTRVNKESTMQLI